MGARAKLAEWLLLPDTMYCACRPRRMASMREQVDRLVGPVDPPILVCRQGLVCLTFLAAEARVSVPDTRSGAWGLSVNGECRPSGQ